MTTEQDKATPCPGWKATPEEWGECEVGTSLWGGSFKSIANCIIELRARIEALEATQQARIDTSGLWQPVKNITPLNGDPSKRLPDPAPELGSLVERVADCLAYRDADQARGVIREVAAWLAQNGWGAVADVLIREASR